MAIGTDVVDEATRSWQPARLPRQRCRGGRGRCHSRRANAPHAAASAPSPSRYSLDGRFLVTIPACCSRLPMRQCAHRDALRLPKQCEAIKAAAALDGIRGPGPESRDRSSRRPPLQMAYRSGAGRLVDRKIGGDRSSCKHLLSSADRVDAVSGKDRRTGRTVPTARFGNGQVLGQTRLRVIRPIRRTWLPARYCLRICRGLYPWTSVQSALLRSRKPSLTATTAQCRSAAVDWVANASGASPFC